MKLWREVPELHFIKVVKWFIKVVKFHQKVHELFCLAEMGQKTLWVSVFWTVFGVIPVKTPNLFVKPWT